MSTKEAAGLPEDRPEDRDGFRFRGGSWVLDLTATLQARAKPSPRELLVTLKDLERWLISAGAVVTAFDAEGPDLENARELREAIYSLAAALPQGVIDPDAASLLNQFAAAVPAVPVLHLDGSVELQGTTGQLLASIARDAAMLFGTEHANAIRQCASAACTIFFIDNSRSGKRRWCSMASCGTRAKVTAHRARKRKLGE